MRKRMPSRAPISTTFGSWQGSSATSRSTSLKTTWQARARDPNALALTGAALLYSWGTLWGVPLFIAHDTLINFLYAELGPPNA